ncbi:MAG: nucleoside recognition domain-containing protein [Clostridia bacterium]
MIYTVPILLLITFVIAIVKKVSLFDSFTEGSKEAMTLILNLIPYLTAIFIAVELMRASGLSVIIGKSLAPVFTLLGVPHELAELIILRPLSGSGSLVLLESIYRDYGLDSYPARVASVIMGSTDTVFYITAVYFSTVKEKRTGLAVPIALVASLFGTVLAAFLCRLF